MKKKIVIIGLGARGNRHLSELRRSDYFELIGLCDKNSDEDFGRFELYDDLRGMLSTLRPDAVVIATPAHTHKELVLICMKFVRNIFLLTPSLDGAEQARELRYVAGSNELNLAVGFYMRFNPAIISLKKELEKVSQIYSIALTHGTAGDGHTDAVSDMLVGDIDLLNYLLGGHLHQISRHYMARAGSKECAYATVVLQNRAGCLINVYASTMYPYERQYMEICTDLGIFLVDMVGFTLQRVSGAQRINLKTESEDMALRYEYEAFARVCDGGEFGELGQIGALVEALELLK